jgi:polysaccharide export outer membrane protein
LDGFLRQPHVTVYVKQFNSKKVFVLGQVKKPGMFAYQESMNVVQAIALAGGFTGLAEENYVTVTREEGDKQRHIRIPVRKIVADKGSQNFLLRPGDIVFVPEAVM